MKVAIIGSGYVGLVSGACFADFGHDVVCVDRDPNRIQTLKAGKIPIFEPGLDRLVALNVAEGRLHFTMDLKEAVREAEVVFIAVGTPARRGDGHADLSYVYAAAREIASAVCDTSILVTKSTVPVGTGDEIEVIVKKLRPDTQISVVSNPEFLREGAAIEDFKRPDRIIVGTDDFRARQVMAQLYAPLNLNEPPLLFMSRRSAELTKYAGNAFLATKITFINEVADLCEVANANVSEVVGGIGLDRRIGSKFLHPGPGYGGSCFPKDTAALARTAQEAGAPLQIVETVIAANEARKRRMAEKIIRACGGSVFDKQIGVLGLSFKPNTDDVREAPSLTIIPLLHEKGAKIRAYDPEAIEHARSLLPDGIQMCEDAYECASGSDALVIITEWDSFRALDLLRIKSSMRQPTIIDLRNIYKKQLMLQMGFLYEGVGVVTQH